MNQKIFIHVDMNAFFASIEQRDFPKLSGMPVAVTNGKHGSCIITCSYEARAFGIKTGMKIFEGRKICPNLIQRPSRPKVYAATSARKDGYILAKSKGKLRGTNINFPKISVGATENSIIAACLAKGKTVLKNCAIEPEIKDLTNFLNKAGAKIKWKGRVCKIIGVNSLNETEYSVMADRIEAGTFCVAATLTKGNLQINNLNPKIISTEIKLLKKVGAKIKTSENKILIKGPEKIKSIKSIKTKEFPGIPTDLQAQLMVLMCKAVGKSSITESIFENRFMHVAELQRLGAKINIKNNTATIEGNTKFIGAELMSSDLRASVALVLAAIVSTGTSFINRIYHLDRGYEKIENKLKKIGVKIKRLKK